MTLGAKLLYGPVYPALTQGVTAFLFRPKTQNITALYRNYHDINLS